MSTRPACIGPSAADHAQRRSRAGAALLARGNARRSTTRGVGGQRGHSPTVAPPPSPRAIHARPARRQGSGGQATSTHPHRPDRPTDEWGPSRNPESEESGCENHQPVDERETTRPTGESPGPEERANRLRTGLNVSHGRHRPATPHCERPGAHNQGHTTRQDTPHDQDTCRVCSPAGRRNVCVERAVCVRRTPARGGGGQGCAGGGGPIYSRPGLLRCSRGSGGLGGCGAVGLVYFCGGTGVAGGSVGGHEVPAAGSSPLICGRGRAPAGWLGLCGPGVPS